MKMADLMQQAQQFQQKIADIQHELGGKSVAGSSGGGMVTATFNGRAELMGIVIEKEVVSPDDLQLLQDLVVSAVNDGLVKAKQLGKTELGKLTGGMSIPGLF